ncbi:MAG: hypothetical protein K2L87_03275, partial [Clostridiales bacterium]|nr:hypothetical protein [Clostridiales bacterium]
TYTGGMRDHNIPYGAGTYAWAGGGPEFTVVNGHGWLTGYGTLDMKNGIEYYGPLSGGLFAPVDMWTGLSEKVTVAYPENADYSGETFEGNYVYNEDLNAYELKGTITYQDGTTIEDVTVALDFSFSYRYLGTFESGGITYTGEMRDHNVPYGAGTYVWAGGPEFTATEGHGWLTGYGTLDMKNGITYEGPLNAVQLAIAGGNEFQPYTAFDGTVVDTVKITTPEGIFEGTLEHLGVDRLQSAGVKGFYGNATYLSVGTMNKGDETVPALFIPSFGFGIYELKTTEQGVPVVAGGLSYEGQYIVVGAENIPFGKGQTYWVTAGQAPYIESDFFFHNSTGVVKFVQVGYTYEGGMSLQVFGAECGVAEATVTFDDGRTFAGVWEDGVLKGTLTMQDGSTTQGTIQITLVTCEFTEVSE